jgi:hypothetical protein
MQYTVPVNLPLRVPDTFGERFKDEIEAALSRRVRPAKAGRPKTKLESKAEIPVSV